MERTFFRIVKSARPTEEDFTSNFARGRPPRRSELLDPQEYRSISAFARLEDARSVQRRFPRLGSYIAELDVADDDTTIVVRKASDDPRDSHHNLQGEPGAFLRRVRRVYPADEG